MKIRCIWLVISALSSSGVAVDAFNPPADLFTFNWRAGSDSRFYTILRHEGSISLRCSPASGLDRVFDLGADLNVEEGREVDSPVVCAGISSESL